jgi:CubicO group peptidase (beta-lactamase class C family)
VTLRLVIAVSASLALAAASAARSNEVPAADLPTPAAVDAEVARAMAATGTEGMALAIIDDGQVVSVRSYGRRNAAGDPATSTPAGATWREMNAGVSSRPAAC